VNRTPEEPEPGDSAPRPGDDPEFGHPEFGHEDEGPFYAWLPPEDRLWRHPSESAARAAASASFRPRATKVGDVLRSTWVVAVLAGLVGALAATGVGVASGIWPQRTTVVRPSVESTSAVSLAYSGAEPANWSAVTDAVAPSIVGVSVNGANGPQVGTGVVVLNSNGLTYLVTDRSLLLSGEAAGYTPRITVTFLSGQAAAATLVGQDALSGLAVLVTASPASSVPADLGSVSTLHVAAPVLAVGSRQMSAVFAGSVSQEDLTVPLTDGTDLDGLLAVTMPNLSSMAEGGPLLDQSGEVVGITVGLQPADSADQQFTFAVPGDEVARIATELINGKPLTHPWLGVTNTLDVPSTMAHQLGLSGGVQAVSVATGSPAARAGIQPYDIVTALNGKSLDSTGALVAMVNACPPSTVVPVTYVHDGRTVSAQIRVGEEPSDS
jgi:putative serine protease PepD